MSRPWTFCVIEGIDGCGKTAIAKRVAARLGSLGVEFCDRRRARSGVPYHDQRLDALASLIWAPGEGDPREAEYPREYWMSLQRAWYEAFGSLVLLPRLRTRGVVVVDGWWFKFAAKLHASGEPWESVLAMFGALARPGTGVLLDVSPHAAWNRKSYSLAERGLHLGADRPDRETFLTYQDRVAAALRELADRFGWRTLGVHEREPEVVTADRVADAIRSALAWSSS